MLLAIHEYPETGLKWKNNYYDTVYNFEKILIEITNTRNYPVCNCSLL